MLEQVLSVGRELLSAEGGSVWLYDPTSETFLMRLPALVPLDIVGAGQGLLGECLVSNTIAWRGKLTRPGSFTRFENGGCN